jgi:hypothetical protein
MSSDGGDISPALLYEDSQKVLEETSHPCQNTNQYEYFGYPAASGPQFGETSN